MRDEPNTEDPADEHTSETNDDDDDVRPVRSEHDFIAFSNVLDGARPYHWLLAMMRCEMSLAPTEPDCRSLIRKRISERIPSCKISRHRQPQTYEITIETHWNPWDFFERQQYSSSPEETAENVIVVVGSETNAQATTCLEYMVQTWPMTGEHTLNCFLGLLKDGSSFSQSVGTDGISTISMSFQSGRLTSISRGTRAFVTEISEQLVWLESAMQNHGEADNVWPVLSGFEYLPKQSTEEDVGSVTPSASRLSYITAVSCGPFRVVATEPGEGQCWHALFRSVPIVQGFPIPKRLEHESGLELSLDLMASWAQARYFNVFRQTPMIKGFSSLLYPTKQSAGSTTWHLRFNEDGSHISFMEGISCYAPTLDIPAVSQGRHILGWCKKAEFYAGAPDAMYAVDDSMLPAADANCVLGGANIHQGTLLKQGNFQLGVKDVPTRLGRFGSDPYSRCLQWLHAQRVVLWDEADKRGWLINGVSALLHLLRAYIAFTSESDFGAEFLLNGHSLAESADPHSARAAVEVLMNEHNRNLKLFPHEPEQLKDQVEHLFNILEQMIAHQGAIHEQCLVMPGSELSRKRVEGWDFSEFAQGRDPIDAWSAEIPVVGRSWIDLVRSIGAVVLFGRGFGDLIRPVHSTVPCLWDQVPHGSYYLTSLVRDIQGLGQVRCPRSGNLTTRIGARFDLHIPSKIFKPCRCTTPQAEDHDSYVQVVLPSGSSELLRLSEPLDRPLTHGGAIIFGHNPAFSWVWKDFGPPELGNPLLFRDPEPRATPSSDSGYSSQAASSNAAVPSEPEIGIICALSKELKAVWALLDCADQRGTDANPYLFGHLGGYSVVAACLPQGEYGTSAAAAAAAHLARSFPQLEFTLLVGIGGGIPSSTHDIRLGDVVVGLPANPQEPGVVQYDAGKIRQDGFELKRSSLQPPPLHVKKVVATMEADPNPPSQPLDGYLRHIAHKSPKYAYPGADKDILYEPNDLPVLLCETWGASGCMCTPQDRPPRPSTHPQVHYGPIASGNSVVKDAATRDELARVYGAICVEMEAAGIANELQCVVIRGICDYADSHKTKLWQEYAAATAAAYAKHLLTQMRRSYPQRRKRKRAGSGGSSPEARERRGVYPEISSEVDGHDISLPH
ncbi:uncharacterized protein B0I36DRAFT_248435 [Microdochium trichocladiopsis]|uniref:Nucleoside phosphorylase domain-containing protein n=1 Tax=Microdochium trichocladiopsis TaxID=1682393 RepID=A0A9P8Y2B7_9PEZI|nr:uncharacterized protein B0I36DRAFT_248435 [Microdochium trichocladiopsis]KAH7026264.1 hypothetical protein B0I36DRAFT_248435 [Microdochium trichocladiopsis]